jgi:hypothetical protein
MANYATLISIPQLSPGPSSLGQTSLERIFAGRTSQGRTLQKLN